MSSRKHGNAGLDRRNFLVLGTAAAATLSSSVLRSDVLRETPMPVLSVAYWDGHSFSDASRVSGDAAVAEKGARISVLGFSRAEAYRGRTLTLGLRAYYPAVDPATGQNVSLHAWRWRSDVAGVSGRTPVTVPFEETLDLGIVRIDSVAPAGRPSRRLSELFARPGQQTMVSLKPRRGRYYVAVRESNADNAPSWSTLAVDPASHELHGAFGSAVPFSYMVLQVE